MTCDDEVRLLLGAYVLGGLSDEDHRTFAAHLRTCPHCQVEAAQLSGLPRLLDLVDDPTEASQPVQSLVLDSGPEPSATLLAEVRRHRRRRRVRLIAAACALGLALLGAGWYIGARIATPATSQPTAQLSAVPESGSSAQVQLALISRAWGTQLELSASQLPTQGQLTLWIVDAGGQAAQVATWNATPAGRAVLSAACATPTAQIRTVQIRTSSGEPIATATS